MTTTPAPSPERAPRRSTKAAKEQGAAAVAPVEKAAKVDKADKVDRSPKAARPARAEKVETVEAPVAAPVAARPAKAEKVDIGRTDRVAEPIQAAAARAAASVEAAFPLGARREVSVPARAAAANPLWRHQRPHRFPPLAQLVARGTAPEGSGGDGALAYQQGLDQGYAEGLRSGEEAGHAQGLANGRSEGLRLGVEQARREAQAQFAKTAEPVDVILDALQKLQADYQAALRDEVVDLVGKVARQVIRCELALQPMQILAMVDETLATLPRVRSRDVEVFLHPEDLQRITDLDPERAKQWKLMPDPRLEPGECHVRAGRHEADAGCRQRQAAVMEQVRTQLKGADAQSSPPALQVVRA